MAQRATLTDVNRRYPSLHWSEASPEKQDVDLSISAQLRALRADAEQNEYHVVRACDLTLGSEPAVASEHPAPAPVKGSPLPLVTP